MSSERYYPALNKESHELSNAVQLAYSYIYELQDLLRDGKIEIPAASGSSQQVVFFSGGGGNSSGTVSDHIEKLWTQQVRPIRDKQVEFILDPALTAERLPGIIIDTSGIQGDGAFASQRLFIGASHLGPENRKQISMMENDGVITLSGCKIIVDEFSDWRVGETMGAGISFGGEDLTGDIHLVYGGATLSSVGETSGRALCARMYSTHYRQVWAADASGRFCFREFGPPPLGATVHTGATSTTSFTDAYGRNMATVFGIAAGDVVYNITDGSRGIVTSTSTSTVTFSGGLSGGSGNNCEAGDFIEFYKRGIRGYDFEHSTGESGWDVVHLWSIAHNDTGDTYFQAGTNNLSRGMLLLGADVTATSGPRASVIGLQAEDETAGYIFLSQNGRLRIYPSDPGLDDTVGSMILAASDAIPASSGACTITTGSANPGAINGWLIIDTESGTIGIPYMNDPTP